MKFDFLSIDLRRYAQESQLIAVRINKPSFKSVALTESELEGVIFVRVKAKNNQAAAFYTNVQNIVNVQ